MFSEQLQSQLIALHNNAITSNINDGAYYRAEIARLQTQISNLTGYKHPSRAILEYALKTQQGSSINLEKANKEFFETIK